ncbi:MAG: transglutaminase domain-containing protein [Nannocystales bacterium]
MAPRAFWLGLLCLLAACAARLDHPAALTRGRLEQNAKLGPEDHAQRAAFASDLGLGTDAIFHATKRLERAQATARVARAAEAPNAQQAAAQRELRRAANMGLRLGRRFGDGNLVLSAALAKRRPNAEDLIWGCEHSAYWEGDPRELLKRTENDPEAWLAVWHLLQSADGVLGGVSALDSPPPGAVMRELGASGNDVRWSVLTKDVRAGALSQRAVELAATISKHDPSDLRARILLELREAMRAGTLIPDADLFADQVALWSPLSVLSRARRRSETYADAPAAQLHYAHRLLVRGLSGDALMVLEAAEASWSSESQRDLAELIEGLALVHAGKAEAYDLWRSKHKGASFLAADRALARWRAQVMDWAHFPDPETPLGTALQAALLRRVAVRDPQLTQEDDVRLWASGALSRSDRRWVKDRIGPALPLLDRCLEQQHGPQLCGPLLTQPYSHATWALGDAGLDHAAADTLLGWVGSADLDEAGWAALQGARDTTLALSSTFTNAYVSGLMKRGSLGQADDWLQRFGNTLPTPSLAALQLTLADKLAGRDEATHGGGSWLDARWWGDVPSVGFGMDAALDAAAPWPSRMQTASIHVRAGAFSKAEEIYGQLAEGLPAPASTLLYGLAGRAAFEAGELEDARNHLAKVPANDPARRETEALMLAESGDVPGARDALVDLWPQRPTASRHLLELGVSLQTDAGLLAMTRHGALSFAVIRAVEQGSITDLKTLARMQALSNDPQQAWEASDSLVPDVLYTAIDKGTELLNASTSLADARPLAAKLVALHQRAPYAPNETILDLMLLTGEHQAALSVARTEVPEDSLYALESTHALVRLHQAALDDAISDDVLWHEWRWRSDLGAAAEHEALLDNAKGATMLGYACMLLSDAPEDPRALPTCRRAWEAERASSWQSAVNYSYLLLQQDVPSPTALATLFEGRPPPPYQASTAPLRDRADIAVLHQNLGAWLSMGNQPERAAHSRIEGHAFARYSDNSSNEVPEPEYAVRAEQAHAGTLSESNVDVATRYARLAYQGLRGQRPRSAQHYAEVSAAMPEDPQMPVGPLGAARAHALAPLLAEDLASERAPAEVLGSAVSLAFESYDTASEVEPMHAAHPESAVLQLVLAEAETRHGRHEHALTLLTQLEDDAPTNPLVSVVAAMAHAGSDDIEGAKASIARGRGAYPQSALFRHAPLPESVLGARPGLPAWIRSTEAFDGRLASISPQDMDALIPRYRSHTEIGADGFFPLAWDPRPDEPLSAEGPGGEWLSVTQEARASRCLGEECLRPTLDALAAHGYTQHFVRSTELPGGEAVEATLSSSTNVWAVASIPVGGRVFTLIASAPYARADSMLTAFALLRKSFAPLDAVVPAFAAATVRADGHTLVDRLRLKARLEAAAFEGQGCPATTSLANAPGSAAAELMLDLYLSSSTVADRRRVLDCASPGDRTARRVSLATLLDDDAGLHAWGRKAVLHHPSRALRDAKHLLPMGIPLSAPDYFDRTETGPRGRIELGLALPEINARRWTAELLAGGEEDAVQDAWVIASQRPGLVDTAQAYETAVQGPPSLAFLAFDVLEVAEPSVYARAVRSRFDALDPKTLPKERRWETRSLGYGLVELADAQDGPRLRNVAKRFDDKEEGHQNIAKMLRQFSDWHGKVVAGAAHDAKSFNPAQRAMARAAKKPRSAEVLAKSPLPELLPTRHWTFSRVASPGLFASTVLDLAQRLDPGDPTVRLMLDRAVESVRKTNGFDALLEGGGLDLSEPIECANMAGDSGFVCAATVLDQDALLTELGQRGYDSDAGLAIVLRLSNGAGLLPVALSILPGVLHELVYQEVEKEDKPQEDPEERRTERFRHRKRIAGHELHYYAIIDAQTSSIGTDAERYLFVGDRVLVFSNDFMARRVLFEPAEDTPSLGQDPEFISLTRGWKDGSALQAAFMGMSSPIDDASVASEVVADGKGVAFQYSATTDAHVLDMTNAHGHLPPGAVSTLVVGYPEQKDDDDLRELTEVELAAGDVVPPTELLLRSTGAALGWYPAVGDGLWKQWVLVFPSSKPLRAAAAKSGVRGPTGTPKRSRAGWWYGSADGLVLIASTEALLRTALSRPPARTGGPHLLGRGSFDGARASKVIAKIPVTATGLDRVVLRFFAGAVGLVEDVGFEATWEPSTRVGRMQGRMSLRLRDRDASEVVDQWLASARFRNAAALPRTLPRSETDGTLRFKLAVGDAQTFVDQSVYPSARGSARAVDETHVELVVRAKARDTDAAAVLSESREKELLKTSNDLRIHAPEIETVRDSLTKPDMDATAKATAITQWVHERVAYEVTPRSIDATQILKVGRGDCSEYALLTVSLLRAAGVPAEVRSGMAAEGDDMVAHAWVAYHDGKRWFEIDPTWGRMAVTAGHLPLEVSDVLALVSLGQMEIEAIEVVK